MARAILLVGAAGWLLAAVAGGVIAIAGIETLTGWLPPLTIDTDAVRGAVVAIAAASALVAATHAAVLLGLRRELRWASTVATLLCALLATLAVALAVAALTSAAVDPANGLLLGAAAIGAALAGAGYAGATMRLLKERKAASASRRPG